MKIQFLVLVAVLAAGCQQPPAILLTIENIPAASKSVRVAVTHGEMASVTDPPPFEVPQPAPGTSSILLILPAEFTGDVSVSVGAFKDAAGAGCLLATGSTNTLMLMGPNDALRVQLVPADDSSCTGNPVVLSAVSPAVGNVNGNETITLNGWGFKPGATVTFGTAAAPTVTYVSGTQLRVVTPTLAGVGVTVVTIKNPNQDSASRSDLFRFYADAVKFTGFPSVPTGDYGNASGVVLGLFSRTATGGFAVTEGNNNLIRITLITGVISSSVTYPMPPGSMPNGLAAADFNHDGNLDLVVNSPGDSMVRILLNDDKGNLTAKGSASLGGAGINPETMVTGDLNGDGHADVVVANRGGASVTILMGDGQGGFKSQETILQLGDPVSVAIGDINLDGAPDIVVASATGTGAVSILFNDNGLFAERRFPRTVLMLGKLSSLFITDVNHDGTADLLAINSVENKVVVVHNMGLPNVFTFFLPTETAPRAVQAADLNGDGYPDLVVPCNVSSHVDIFLNDSGRGFAKVAYTSVPASCKNPVQAAIADLDRDGRLDVCVFCQLGVGFLLNRSGS